ncbi:MAG: hypothetical protein P8O79_05850 [Halieaceae bacterium]|nr:hypothetical protein [Halieaceae bacterium]
MKALAQFAMRGQWQAMFLTIAGAGSALFCWVSAAIIALVSLQQGPKWGGYLLFWALLPSGLLVYVYGDAGPLMLLVSAWLMASALRLSGSLSTALLSAVPIGLISGGIVVLSGQNYLEQLVSLFDSFIQSVEQSMQSSAEIAFDRPTTLQIAGILALSNAFAASASVLLGAYWQSALYRPGLFGRVYVRAVVPATIAIVLVAFAAAMVVADMANGSWAAIFCVPLVFTGLGYVHARGRAKHKGKGYFTGFYALWVVFDFIKLAVVGIALLDSVMGLRKQFLPSDSQSDRDKMPTDHDKDL